MSKRLSKEVPYTLGRMVNHEFSKEGSPSLNPEVNPGSEQLRAYERSFPSIDLLSDVPDSVAVGLHQRSRGISLP
jgi:hypothetical protein